jgi:hypothetical protein
MNPIVKRESPLRPELILNISCGEPVRALDLGGLLTVISRDYRNFSVGEDLVITWVAEGSLLIGLATKAALTNHVITFAKHIRDLLKGLLGGSAALLRSRSQEQKRSKTCSSSQFLRNLK